MSNGKPIRRDGESKKEFKVRKKAWKRDQKEIKRYEKAGITDPEFLAHKQGRPPKPLEPRERPIPTTKTREDGGQREDGSYVRRSTVNIDKIEAHLDTMMEKDRGESLQDRFKEEFGEDLDVPEGYELIPDRSVHKRAAPPSLADAERDRLSAETLALAYGGEGPPPAPTEIPGEAPPPVPEPVPGPEPEPEPVPEPEPEPAPEPEPEPEVAAEPEAVEPEEAPEEMPEVEAEMEAEEAPAEEPEPAPTPAAPVAGAVAGVAGADSATAGVEAAAKVEDDLPPAKYPFFHILRFVKLGRRAWINGGPIVKLILFFINLFLWIGFMLILLAPLWYSIVYTIKKYSARKKEEAERWAEQYPDGEYAEGYGEYSDEGYAHAQPPEGEYSDEGYHGDEYYGH